MRGTIGCDVTDRGKYLDIAFDTSRRRGIFVFSNCSEARRG